MDLVDVPDVVVGDGGEVSAVHVRHPHFGHSAGSAVTQVTAVVVQVAEPHRLTSDCWVGKV